MRTHVKQTYVEEMRSAKAQCQGSITVHAKMISFEKMKLAFQKLVSWHIFHWILYYTVNIDTIYNYANRQLASCVVLSYELGILKTISYVKNRFYK